MKLTDKIDNYFYDKSQKDIMMFYLAILMLIGFIMFYYILPFCNDYRDNQIKQYNQSKIKMQAFKVQNSVLNTRFFSLQKKLKQLKTAQIELKKQKDFYDELVDLLDFTVFNEQKWSEFVKNLVFNARNEGLKIISFENKIFDKETKDLINKKMEIVLKMKGEYIDIISFIYKYENIRDLLRIESMNIDKNNSCKIKFVLYGYTQ